MSKRVAWIDISKGIAILLVIIGHCLPRGTVCAFIFDFHMPLFFFLSSLTSSYSKDIKEFKANAAKSFKRLVIPAVLMFVFRTLFDYIFNITDIKTTSGFSLGYISIDSFQDYLLYNLRVLLYASGADIWKNDIVIRTVGILWFLFVLFEARTLFDFMQLKLNKKVCLILSIVMCIVSIPFRDISYNLFSIDVVFTVMPIMYAGYALKGKEYSKKKISYFIVSLLVYLIAVYFTNKGDTYLELASREYPYFPFCFVIAGIGIFSADCFAKLIEDTKAGGFLQYFGKNSMILYCIHYFDYLLTRRWFYQCLDVLPSILIRLCVDIVVMMMVLKLKEVLNRKVQKEG